MENLSARISSSHANITHDSLPVIEADKTLIILLLQNLIDNAIKFSGPSPPSVHISASKCENEWIFSVQDNGIGIEPACLERIFAVFERLDARKSEGTGIGLAICKKIVDRHNGRIWAESKPGAGSAFCFTIPIKGDSDPP
jgi:two-component system, chemotaxis family, sensor kinase Cph1